MKILITGKSGYIARSIHSYLYSKYDITIVGRQDFDLTDQFETLKYFSNKHFDVVIHCAVSGGSRLKPDNWDVLDDNLKMYYNLLNCSNKFKKLIHFGSGAEIYSPETPYGLSKKVIAKSITEKENFYNLRIYGVFDENELDTRFIKANIKRYINKESIQIFENKTMDFIYMKDLINIVEHYINSNDLPKEIDCVYSNNYTLQEIAKIINKLDKHKVDIILLGDKKKSSYIGSFTDLGINYQGLIKGIFNTYINIL
jgi:nucleoside-diphosphate-sugar epimerase